MRAKLPPSAVPIIVPTACERGEFIARDVPKDFPSEGLARGVVVVVISAPGIIAIVAEAVPDVRFSTMK